MEEVDSPTEDVYSVSDLNEIIKITLKNINNVIVIGEISNLKYSKNNIFFTMKDEEASINAVIWNNNVKKNKEELENGKKIKVTGQVLVYSKYGSYNLSITKVELIGLGDISQEYIKLKKYFEENGYFDTNRKKKLPCHLNNIGVITAVGGAAIQDFLYVLKNNGFIGKVNIQNCLVQGKDCPESVIDSIKKMDKLNFDVIVITRGGGSFEDLFGFSNEEVVKTIHGAKTCIISAIGHEIDFMLSDYVADIRAPTPSIAAEIISKKEDWLNINELDKFLIIVKKQIENKIKYFQNIINSIIIKNPTNIFDRIILQNNFLEMNITKIIRNKIDDMLKKLKLIEISNDDPNIKIKEGDCFVFDYNDKKINTLEEFIEATSKKKKLKLKFYDGDAIFQIRSIKL